MIKAVLFDLDLTLIASAEAEPLRRARRWSDVHALVPRLLPYEGVHELLAAVRSAGLKSGIVTSAPRMYAERVVKHWRWDVDVVVGYHDTQRRKPAPDPINHALAAINIAPPSAMYVGDHADDITAARAAGVLSTAAFWGALDQTALQRSGPSHIVASVAELRQLLGL
jgi:HAD superfamily hydrolase (TIGR01509 family)